MNRRRPSTVGQMAKSRQVYFEAIVEAFEGFIYVCAPDNRIEFTNRQATEVLAGIVLTQLSRGGSPVVFAGSSSCSAMRYGTLSIGAPEMAVNTAATAQMARFYGIPSRGGALSDAKLPDAQAGFEAMMSQLMATLSGVHFVLHSAGILEGYMVSSYEKFVLDDEICGMCKRIKRGERDDEDRLAFDLIRQVGPGGEYLTQRRTQWRSRTFSTR